MNLHPFLLVSIFDSILIFLYSTSDNEDLYLKSSDIPASSWTSAFNNQIYGKKKNKKSDAPIFITIKEIPNPSEFLDESDVNIALEVASTINDSDNNVKFMKIFSFQFEKLTLKFCSINLFL